MPYALPFRAVASIMTGRQTAPVAANLPRLAVAALTLTVTLSAAGCGSTGSAPQVGPGGASPGTPARHQCADVYQPGQIIAHAKAQGGCLGPDGALHVPGTFFCDDGRRLWLVYGSSGALSGWGFSDDVYVASDDPAADPAYIRAHAACVT